MLLSREALSGARRCLGDRSSGRQLRSAISRAYYAAFSAAHAALIGVGCDPRPGLGTWAHAQLPELIRVQMAKRLGKPAARDAAHRLALCRTVRYAADYDPREDLDLVTASRCIADATVLVRRLGASI